jgi:hypothetical protein
LALGPIGYRNGKIKSGVKVKLGVKRGMNIIKRTGVKWVKSGQNPGMNKMKAGGVNALKTG